MNVRIYCLIFATLFFVSCDTGTAPKPDETEVVATPAGFPKLPQPENNRLTQARIDLGKKLFFDKKLSRNNEIACGNCHLQEKAFSDPNQFSKGVENKLGVRNAPPLFNMAWNTSFFWDGGVPTLEQQAIGPITNPLEMNTTLGEVVSKIAKDENYIAMFKAAYDTVPSSGYLTKAIASFMRSLVSSESRYDKYSRGDTAVYNESEKRGYKLFFGEDLFCHHCHIGYNFTTYQFANNGSKDVYKDVGRMLITKNKFDEGKFKIPSLRNILVTAPYMHDGSFKTLEEVILNYAKGGSGHANQDPTIVKFNITDEQIKDLIAFLNTLTDEKFLTNSKYKP